MEIQSQMQQINSYAEQLLDMVTAFAPKLLLSALVLVVGLRIIHRLAELLEAAMKRGGMNDEIRPFLASVAGTALRILLIFSVAGIVGIETTSFVAVLAAAGFAVGMALQGSLSNFAAGVMLLMFRPYKIGDLVQLDGVRGYVVEIQIFNTILCTLNNETVIIPNAASMANKITNFSQRSYLRLELEIPIFYSESFDRVAAIIRSTLLELPEVLDKPEPEIGIKSFDSHNVILIVHPYTRTEDYWTTHYKVHQELLRAFAKTKVQLGFGEGLNLGEYGSNIIVGV